VDIEQAIKTAIEYENRVVKVYEEACDGSIDPVGKRIFGLLRDEERNHVAFLEARLASWREDGKLSAEGLETAIPEKHEIENAVAKLEGKLEPKQMPAEAAMLERARQVETETSGYYRKLVAELGDEGREFFSRFVEIEEGHLAIVEAELSAVKGMGFYFDMSEFDLEKS
jgi:rubrerythrin